MDEQSSNKPSSVGLPLPRHESDAVNPMAYIEKAAESGGWRMKMAKAAAQLFAGTEKGSQIYGDIRDRLDVIEGRSIVSKAMAQAIADRAINNPEMLQRAQARFFGNLMQQQENLEAVVIAAQDKLLLLPEPEISSRTTGGEPEIGGSETSTSTGNSQPLHPDWASTFSSVAENATTEDLRGRLASILAGELRSPGMYSRSTVRLVAELEQNDLEAMRRALPFVMKDVIVRSHDDDDAEPTVSMALPLAEAGLVTEASGTLALTWSADPTSPTINAFTGSEWLMQVEVPAGHQMRIGIFRLTRAGVAVVDLLGRVDEQEVIRWMTKSVPEEWTAVRMAKIVGPGAVELPWVELYPTAEPATASRTDLDN